MGSGERQASDEDEPWRTPPPDPIDDDSPAAWRRRARSGRHASHTVGRAAGFLQGNLAIVPESLSRDFLLYCHRNPKPCPLIGVGDPGEPSPARPRRGSSTSATDVPAYRVFRHDDPGTLSARSPDGTAGGELVGDLLDIWRDDLVAFVLGCSFSFEDALAAEGIPVRHRRGRAERADVPHRRSRRARPGRSPARSSSRCAPSARPTRSARSCSSERFRLAHGAPVHLGDPRAIGIEDLDAARTSVTRR